MCIALIYAVPAYYLACDSFIYGSTGIFTAPNIWAGHVLSSNMHIQQCIYCIINLSVLFLVVKEKIRNVCEYQRVVILLSVTIREADVRKWCTLETRWWVWCSLRPTLLFHCGVSSKSTCQLLGQCVNHKFPNAPPLGTSIWMQMICCSWKIGPER